MPPVLELDADTTSARSRNSMERRTQLVLAIVIAVGLNLAFLLSFWNRFLGPGVSGMFLEFASRLMSGMVPYRDFYVVVTPFYIFRTAAIVKLFGPSLAILRLVDIGYRCALAAILVVWLSKVVRIPYALIGALTAIAVFSTDPADPLTSYHLEGTFWAVSAAFLLSYVLWQKNDSLRNITLICSSGAGASVCFFTKQTEGGGISLALAIVLAGLSLRDRGIRTAILRFLVFCAGWMIPAGAILGWLASKGALRAFATAIFLDGPSAKGSPIRVLTRVFVFGFGSWPVFALYVMFGLCTMFLVVGVVRQRAATRSSAPPALFPLATIALGGGAALFTGYAAAVHFPHISVTAFLLEVCCIFFGFFGVLALAVYYSAILARRGLTETEKQRWLLVMASFWICYTMSWSWVVWGPMAFPSLGVVLALILDGLHAWHRRSALRYTLAAAAIVLLSFCEAGRAACPFKWDSWTDDPVWKATARSRQPALSGISMSPEMAAFADRLTGLIDAHSRASDSVFVYSYQPLWYVLANRWPPTYAQVHFFDVAPDDLCRRDAARLAAHHPAVILDFVGESEFRDESAFRAGQKSGQRDLYNRMYQLIHADYRLEAAIPIQESPVPVRVFVLRSNQ
jgi:hypothetical protein